MSNLNLGEHISQQFNEDLEEARSKVLQMGGVVEEQLERAISALVNNDNDLARKVVKNDVRVNALEVEIDEECTRLVARRQPAASDLRLVMAVIKTITDLERIGDEVKRVAIDPSLLHEDKEIIEDLVAAACNDAVRRVEKTQQEKMAEFTGGLNLPGIFGS